jgi:hypothetical protein
VLTGTVLTGGSCFFDEECVSASCYKPTTCMVVCCAGTCRDTPAPVPVGTRVRCYAQIVEIDEVGGGWHQVVTRFTVEAEGGEKPVCVADSVGRVLLDDDA